ncbi:MAG TPA: hypothetical protein DEQ09_08915 [Bacteroidales bacterium]|nr:hypothetical protein [Bacteroidales bacterium]
MIIQSKKFPDRIREVTIEEWHKMQRIQISRRFRILSNRDLAPAKKIEDPGDVINYMGDNIKKPEVKKIYDEDKKIPEDEIIDYNTMLKSDLINECERRSIELTGKELKIELIEYLNNK